MPTLIASICAILLFFPQTTYSEPLDLEPQTQTVTESVPTQTQESPAAVEVLTSETLKEIEESQKHQEILTNETLLEINNATQTEGAGSFTILESETPQSNPATSEQFDQKTIQALQKQMEESLDTSMKEQMPGLIAGILKVMIVPLIIIFIIAFFINRAIDGAPAEGKQPGVFRRFLALSIDGYIGSVLIGAAITLPGFAIPLDNPKATPFYVIAAILGGLYAIYMIFGYVLFNNTYGRYVMNLKVIDLASNAKPRLGQAFIRTLTFILWPIEGVILLISKSKRRLGDVWAGTRVAFMENSKNFFVRASVGVLIFIIGLGFTYGLTPLALNKMDIANAARDYFQRNQIAITGNPQNAQINATPESVEGTITFKLANDPDGKSIVLFFTRQNDTWVIHHLQYIKKKYLGLLTITY